MSDCGRLSRSENRSLPASVSAVDNKIATPEFSLAQPEEIINGVVKRIEGAAKDKGIRITVNVDRKLPPCLTDTRLLSDALYELLDNAVLYSHRGKEVVVSAFRKNGAVHFSVRDHGIGIPTEQQGSVFTKFFRGQNVPKEAIGAGIGLYLAHEYVSLLKGKIWFTSVEGEGSTFHILIPIKKLGV
jgi:signal transduction histidine kinase